MGKQIIYLGKVSCKNKTYIEIIGYKNNPQENIKPDNIIFDVLLYENEVKNFVDTIYDVYHVIPLSIF